MKIILPLVVFSFFPLSAFAQEDPQCVELGRLAMVVMSARIQGVPAEKMVEHAATAADWNYPKIPPQIVAYGYQTPLGPSFEASIQDFATRVLLSCTQDPEVYMER